MEDDATNHTLATRWLQWVARWFWLLLAALALAGRGGPNPAALAAAGAYAAAQIGLLVAYARSTRRSGDRRVAAVVDTVGPAAVIVAAGGRPGSLLALLLAGAASVGAWAGAGAAAGWMVAALAVVGMGIGWVWGSLIAGLLWSALHLPLLVVAGAVAGWLMGRIGGIGQRSAGGAAGWLPGRRPDAVQPAVARSLPLRETLREEDLVRLTVELSLDALAAAGVPRAEISGLALLCDEAGLRVVGGEHRDVERWLGVHFPREGLLANALDQGTVAEGPVDSGVDLQPLGDELGWRWIACLPLEADHGCFGAALIGSSRPVDVDDEGLALLHALGQEARIALRYADLYEELSQERDRLNEIQEETRKKLARDLHDGPTQAIAAIAMRTNFARRQLARDPQAAAQELETVERMARATTVEIRHLLFTLRPLILESQGLGTALRQYAEKVGEAHRRRVMVEIEDDVEALIGRDREAPLFYIAEEAVNNAHKHAASAHIWVRLRQEDGGVLLEIEDDGVGFNVGAVDAHYDQRGSLGIVSMRERAQLLGGTLEIASEEGHGTSIRAHIPPAPARGKGGGASPAPPDRG